MGKRTLTEEQISAIEDILNSGGSNYQAAEEVLGSRTRESTIRSAIKRGDISVEDANKDDVLSEEQLDVLCEHPDFSISNLAKRLRTAQRTNTQLRKIQRELFDGEGEYVSLESFSKILAATLKDVVPKKDGKNKRSYGQPSKRTVEVLFSDLQIGKCSEFYNTENATKAMSYYGDEVLSLILDAKPEHIVFASLGDIIECSKKHGLQSAYSTDTSNAQQLANATRLMWTEVLEPLVDLGIPMTIIGCAGNHGADAGKGFDMYKAGLYTFDYVIYQSLKLLCDTAGANHVQFKIPEGCFTTHEIYGNTYLYEHGYFNQCTEKSMMDHKKKRMDNVKKYLHGYRCGDMHHVCLYDSSNLVVNGAFFGIEREGAEYSGILGFNSVPAQVVMVHEPLLGNALGQSTVVDTKIIQVAKSYV